MVAQERWAGSDAGNSCPAPMTRAALLALRAAGGLSKDCDYVITDHIQGRLVAGTTIHMQAIDASTLSMAVAVDTIYDNVAWSGIYDIDRALVLELTDNRGNVARGFNGSEVANFDWGNAAYTNVRVEQSTLTVTYGAPALITNVRIHEGSIVTLTGFTGTLNHFEVGIVSSLNLSNANGSWRYGKVLENSNFNASGYTGGGDSYYFEISDASSVNISAASAQINFRTSDLHAMTLNMAGVLAAATTFLGCDLWQSTVSKAGTGLANITRLRMHGNSTLALNSNNSFNITNSVIEDGSSVTHATGVAGALTITGSDVKQQSNITHSGAGALNVTRNLLAGNSNITIDAASNVATTLSDNFVQGNATLRVIGATATGTFNVAASEILGSSFIYKRHAGNLSVGRAYLSGQSRIDAQSGNRNYSFNQINGRSVSRITMTGAGAGITDSLNDIDMAERGVLSISCSGPANSVNYCTIAGLSGQLLLSGTTGSQSINRLKIADGSINIANCTANTGMVLCTAMDAGNITCSGMTAAKSLQYLQAENRSSIVISNSTGGGTITGVKVSAGGSYTVSGAAAGADSVDVSGGAVSHNGGSLTRLVKRLAGTLTTGNFNHSNIVHMMPTGRTLTAANTNRGEYVGLAPGAYAAGGILV